MWRNIASNALTFLVVIVFLFGGVLIWAQNEYVSEGPLEQAICVQVDRGASFRPIADQLAQDGAVSSAALLRIGAGYAEKLDQLKFGSWLIPAAASMEQIVDIVTRGGASTCGTEVVYRVSIARATVQVRALDPATGRFVEVAAFDPAQDEVPDAYTDVKAEPDTRYRVALAEGVTSWQIVQELNQIDILEGQIEEIPAEGSLAPDSYEITPGSRRAEVLSRMSSAQERILAEAWANRQDGLPYASPEEALVMASIIEKETGTADERFLVSSVFVNRLRQGMRLQTDPTVIYGVTRGQGVLGRGIRQSELRAETPWNTYVIDGLPPTPIANPGRASIEAALNPAETDFIFFVARTLDPADGHNFAVTLAEHNANVAAYRALEAQREN